MKFELWFAKDEIRVTLTESLKLLEGQTPQLGSPDGPVATDCLPQIESLMRLFLSGYVVDRDAPQLSDRHLDRRACVDANGPTAMGVIASCHSVIPSDFASAGNAWPSV